MPQHLFATVTALLSLLLVAPVQADDFPPIRNTEKATDAPRDPEEVAKTAKLPEGFRLSVFAAEPQVQNPIAITTDDRGRLWVAENYSWAGAGAGGFDATQRDRIVVLEDADGDGRAERRTVFWDNAHKLTSIEVGNGGVYAICLPHVLFIPDENGDDIPDGEPRILLDGIDEGVVGHTPANGLKWGPDGWLYARHGIQATSSIGPPGAGDSQRIKINTGVWRFHPVTLQVQALMHGMTNSWGGDYDKNGEWFVINTVIGHLWHVLPGAHVQRMYGVDNSAPNLFQLIEQTADHVHWDTGQSWSDVRFGVTDKTSAAGGGHAHIGMMIYQGDNWPESYRNKLYTLNLHGRRINTNVLERDGAGFTGRRGDDFCFIDDSWYRGMDLITGADGGVLIADWSDTGECHDHDGVHRTSGRIYKLAYGTPRKLDAIDLAKESNDSLTTRLSHPNAWWARHARRLLGERMRKAAFDLPDSLKTDPSLALEYRWLLENAMAYSTEQAVADLAHADEAVRIVAIERLIDPAANSVAQPPAQLEQRLTASARGRATGLELLHLASALQALSVDRRWELAQVLVRHEEFATDRMFALMIWYGLEPAIQGREEASIQLIDTAKIPLLRRFIARKLTLGIEAKPAALDQLVAYAATADAQRAGEIVFGMSDALHGWRQAKAPAGWNQLSEKIRDGGSPDLLASLQELDVIFGDGVAPMQLRALVADGSAPADARRQALRALLPSKAPDLLPVLMNLLNDGAIQVDAIRGLANYDDPKIPATLIERLGNLGPDSRTAAIDTLASRPDSAAALINAIKAEAASPRELTAYHARQIQAFNRPELTEALSEVWGNLRETPDDKRHAIASLREALAAETLVHADPGAGRALFSKTCANCHVLYGEGKKVGPDLTGSNRKNLDYLLENILDPSATVGADFRVLLVSLKDGRVISGVVTAKSERTITLRTVTESVTIDRNDIEESVQSTSSIMPEGLLQNMKPQEVANLFSYLMSVNQVALPADK